MKKYKVEKVAFSLSDLDEWQEATPHVEDKKRTFYIFPKEEASSLVWYAIEDTYFLTKDGRIHIPEHFEVPRWRLLLGHSLAHAIRLCKAQVEVDYLVSTGMEAMDAARLALQKMWEEEQHDA